MVKSARRRLVDRLLTSLLTYTEKADTVSRLVILNDAHPPIPPQPPHHTPTATPENTPSLPVVSRAYPHSPAPSAVAPDASPAHDSLSLSVASHLL